MRFISSILTRWASRSRGRIAAPVLAFPLLLTAATAAAETVHISHCAELCPQAGSAREVVIHRLYAAAIDPQSGLAEWVAYRVLDGTVGVASLLPRGWQADALLEEPSRQDAVAITAATFVQPDLSNAQDREYRVNELIYPTVARGRLAPMTSFAGTPYWQELNNLSNMAPLPADLRTGSWARLEQAINMLARQEGEVYVLAGPLVRSDDAIEIPQAYFKAVRRGDRVAAFVFAANLPPHVDYCDQQSTLAAIEAAIGLTLFPGLSAASVPLELGCQAVPPA